MKFIILFSLEIKHFTEELLQIQKQFITLYF